MNREIQRCSICFDLLTQAVRNLGPDPVTAVTLAAQEFALEDSGIALRVADDQTKLLTEIRDTLTQIKNLLSDADQELAQNTPPNAPTFGKRTTPPSPNAGWSGYVWG